jgi:hypothetical protein
MNFNEIASTHLSHVVLEHCIKSDSLYFVPLALAATAMARLAGGLPQTLFILIPRAIAAAMAVPLAMAVTGMDCRNTIPGPVSLH